MSSAATISAVVASSAVRRRARNEARGVCARAQTAFRDVLLDLTFDTLPHPAP
jgi:hypothetical protein